MQAMIWKTSLSEFLHITNSSTTSPTHSLDFHTIARMNFAQYLPNLTSRLNEKQPKKKLLNICKHLVLIWTMLMNSIMMNMKYLMPYQTMYFME